MKFSILLVFSMVLLTAVSCKKTAEDVELEKGCTDLNATNYDANAEENDGSCNYQGDISLWFNEANSNSFDADGITNLTIYFDDLVVGTMDPTAWAIGPECNGENRLTVTVELGNSASKIIDCHIRDQSGTSQFGSNFDVKGNECLSYHIY